MDSDISILEEVDSMFFNKSTAEELRLSHLSCSKSKRKHLRKPEILSHFTLDKNKRYLKKEQLRSKVIRLHKFVIRCLQNKNYPKKFSSLFSHVKDDPKQISKVLEGIVNESQVEIANICRTTANPFINKNCKAIELASRAKSFNDQFCREYFQYGSIRESYYYFLELLFIDTDPNRLCQTFKINCCESNAHVSLCEEKWYLLFKYLQETIIKELDLVPFDEDAKIYSLINEF